MMYNPGVLFIWSKFLVLDGFIDRYFFSVVVSIQTIVSYSEFYS